MFNKQKFNESEVIKFGFLGGIAQAAYCFAVVLAMNFVSQSVPKASNTIIIPLLFLLVFVFSAAVSGIFVFGYPAYLAARQRYLEALMTASITLACLAMIGLLTFVLLSFIG